MDLRGFAAGALPKGLIVAAVALLAAVAYAQVVKINNLVVPKPVSQRTSNDTPSQVLTPSTVSTSSSNAPDIKVEQSSEGNGQVNDSHTTVHVSEDGSSIEINSSTHQSAHSGSVSSDDGSATSGDASNSHSESYDIKHN